jgi:hypothetical protein
VYNYKLLSLKNNTWNFYILTRSVEDGQLVETVVGIPRPKKGESPLQAGSLPCNLFTPIDLEHAPGCEFATKEDGSVDFVDNCDGCYQEEEKELQFCDQETANVLSETYESICSI